MTTYLNTTLAFFLLFLIFGGGVGAQTVVPLPPILEAYTLQPQTFEEVVFLIENRWYERGLKELEKYSDHPDTPLLKAKALIGLHRYMEAVPVIDRFLERETDGGKRTVGFYLKGKSLSRDKRYGEALEVYESMMERGGNGAARAAFKTALEAKQYKEALHYLDYQKGTAAFWYRGWCYFRLGEYPRALNHWKLIDAKRGGDYYPQTLYWRGVVHALMGEREKSLPLWQELVEEYPISYYGYRALFKLFSNGSLRNEVVIAKWSHETVIPKKKRFPLGEGEIREGWEKLYPRVYKEFVRREARRRRLDPYFLLALMRQESYFQESIVSAAGAIGLLQLMPQTALKLAKSSRLKNFHVTDIFRPDVNLRMGALYLRFLKDIFKNCTACVLASYNAGEEAVSRWRSLRETDPEEIFIEEIPYDETQNYVKKILTHYWIYNWLYKSKIPGL